MNTVELYREDVAKIMSILEKFPDVARFELVVDSSSGIGTTCDIVFSQTINETVGDFRVPIQSVEDW